MEKKKTKAAAKKKATSPAGKKAKVVSKKAKAPVKNKSKTTAGRKAKPAVKSRTAVKSKVKAIGRKKVKAPSKSNLKRVAKKKTTAPVIEQPVTESLVHGEDLHLIPKPGEEHPIRPEEAHQLENKFQNREAVAFHQENQKIKEALPGKNVKGYRHRGLR